jgi:hypothetical protein
MKYTTEQVMHAIHDEVGMLEKTDACYDVSISEVVRRAMMRLDGKLQKPKPVHKERFIKFDS